MEFFQKGMIAQQKTTLKDPSVTQLGYGEGGIYHLRIVSAEVIRSETKGEFLLSKFEVLSGQDRVKGEDGRKTLIPTAHEGQMTSWMLFPQLTDAIKQKMQSATIGDFLYAALGVDRRVAAGKALEEALKPQMDDLFKAYIERGVFNGFEIRLDVEKKLAKNPDAKGERKEFFNYAFTAVADKDLVDPTVAEKRRPEVDA